MCNRQSVHVKHMTMCTLYNYSCRFCLFVYGATAPPPTPPLWTRTSSLSRFLDHTQRHTAVGRTHLDELSARRRDLYLILVVFSMLNQIEILLPLF